MNMYMFIDIRPGYNYFCSNYLSSSFLYMQEKNKKLQQTEGEKTRELVSQNYHSSN